MNDQTTAIIETASRCRRGMSVLLAMTALAVGAILGLPAGAVAASPAFSVRSIASPTHFPPGDSTGIAGYAISVKNIGAAPTDGTPITISDTLPAGISLHPGTGQDLVGLSLSWNDQNAEPSLCDPGPPVATCTTPSSPILNPNGNVIFDSILQPGASLVMYLPVDVAALPDPTTVVNHLTVSGGGAATVSTSEQTTVSADPAPFGFQDSAFSLTGAGGDPAAQAGSHPWQLDTFMLLNTLIHDGEPHPAAPLKDVHVDLPPGLVVNPQATPVRCTEAQLEIGNGNTSLCPNASVAGIFHAVTTATGGAANPALTGAVYNMVPPPGVPAEFAFVYNATGAEIFVHVRGGLDSASNYRLTADVSDLLQFGDAVGVDLELWGSPSDPAYDSRRGQCASHVHTDENGNAVTNGDCPVPSTDTPLLTMPSACSGPLQTFYAADSWQEPGNFLSTIAETRDSAGNPVGVNGCSTLTFEPSLTAQPDTSQAASPSGLNVDLKIPQTNSMETLASANLKKTVVTLPAGVSVNPSAADGLGSCSLSQIGLTTVIGQIPAHFTATPDTCPDVAKVGDVQVTTPLLPEPLDGSVYIAQQDQNPFGSLLALYIAIKDPKTGIVIKLPGKVDPDPVTGQLKATFDNTPQLPFSDFQLHFKGGNRGVLVTPSACGSFQTASAFSPWSAADPDNPSVAETRTSSDGFTIASGANGAPCVSNPAQLPFAPSFTAGSLNPTAGAFTPLSVMFSRSDQEQELGGVTVRTAPGLLGRIAGVPFCGEPQAAQGSCSAASQIGHVQVSAGAGPSPVSIPQAGKPQDPVFLTGPYKGAPFGLSIVVPAQAGPFDLGTVVVHAAIYVDPHTAQITVVSDPFPTILRGIPLKVRSVSVIVDREAFVFNPTSCDPMSMGGTLTSTQGVAAGVSSRFQAAGCAGLPFKPGFAASTQGATSKANGASLTVNVSARPGEANIHRVDLQLPKALPARLTTLQKACTAAQFESNPAGCPPGSVIGMATAHTPVLNVPLTGPAYLVSHGGAAFPDVEFVLQANERGGVVEIVLDGATDIKKGITYSRFETVPDAPISSFETVLPTGPHSVLAANIPASAKNNLCGQTLTIPTTIVAQNGASVTQTTRIGVTGCARVKAKALTRSQKLAKALKACHKKAKGAKRASCERVARKKYGPVKKAKGK
jgi:uncharacterized repeat protein (TIGR01451 family)